MHAMSQLVLIVRYAASNLDHCNKCPVGKVSDKLQANHTDVCRLFDWVLR